MLHVVVANPDVALRELDLLTDAEHATMAALSGPPPVAPRFLDDVLATPATGWPDTTGPAGGRGGTTTRSPDTVPGSPEVLRACGAQAETVVALCIGRSPESVAAMRAVATTGPLSCPSARLSGRPDRVHDRRLGAGVIVTTSHDRARLTGVDAVLLNAAIDADAPDLSAPADHEPHESFIAREPAYRSAGLSHLHPGRWASRKPVAVTHRGVASFVAEQRRYRVDADSRVLHFAPPQLRRGDAGDPARRRRRPPPSSRDAGFWLKRPHRTAARGIGHARLPDTRRAGNDHSGTAEPDPLPALNCSSWAVTPATGHCPTLDHVGQEVLQCLRPSRTTVMATLGASPSRHPMLIGPGVTGPTFGCSTTSSPDCRPASTVNSMAGRAWPAATTTDPRSPRPPSPPIPTDRPARGGTGPAIWCVVTDHRGVPALTHQGRADRQLKIRGHRVETGEIEGRPAGECPYRWCRGHLGDRPRTEPPWSRTWCRQIGGGRSMWTGYESACAARLPGYAVPPSIMVLGAIPLTTAGKVDQRALPVPIFGESGYAAPESAMQQLVVEVFCEVLHRDRVGVRDSFFDAGGTSLSAASAVARIGPGPGANCRCPTCSTPRRPWDWPPCSRTRPCRTAPSRELPRPDRIRSHPRSSGCGFSTDSTRARSPENIPLVLRITGDLDVAAFGAALGPSSSARGTAYQLLADSPQGRSRRSTRLRMRAWNSS